MEMAWLACGNHLSPASKQASKQASKRSGTGTGNGVDDESNAEGKQRIGKKGRERKGLILSGSQYS
jgi:hypothetical protein